MQNESPDIAEPVHNPFANRRPRSPAQIAAPRLNGARSRGPVTEQGKTICEESSLRHGLLSNTLLLDAESSDEFEAMYLDAISEFEPATPAELELVTEMICAKWQQMRAWAMVTSSQNDEIREQAEKDPALLNHPMASRAFLALAELSRRENLPDKLHRYETRHSRTYFRLYTKLAALKEQRDRINRGVFSTETIFFRGSQAR